jgi:hypothetical protein
MPKMKFGDTISQAEAKIVRYYLVSNLHLRLPDGWNAWNKTAAAIAEDVSALSGGDITPSPDEIEMIAGRVLPQ